MDLINGHSEKNQPKKRVEVSLEKSSGNAVPEMQELDLSDLPLKMQEEIREFMGIFGLTEPPSIYAIELDMEGDLLPIEMLANSYRDAILEDRYEDAKKIGESIKKQNYSIDITEKMISLTYNK